MNIQEFFSSLERIHKNLQSGEQKNKQWFGIFCLFVCVFKAQWLKLVILATREVEIGMIVV
jgi:hypothetical protein